MKCIYSLSVSQQVNFCVGFMAVATRLLFIEATDGKNAYEVKDGGWDVVRATWVLHL